MSIHYNVTGSERKALVGAISDFLNLPINYKGAPTFAYEIGGCTVDKNGTLSFAQNVAQNTIDTLEAALAERGYVGVPPDDNPDGSSSLVVEISRNNLPDEAINNLRKIVASKDRLIKKALGLDDSLLSEACLPIKVEEDKLRFPWFTLTGTDGEADAYSRFICALCDMAKTQKRITAKERDVDNDKFTMRLFLVRLGLKGPENKPVRQTMLKNLTGNSSWKNGQAPTKNNTAQEVISHDE